MQKGEVAKQKELEEKYKEEGGVREKLEDTIAETVAALKEKNKKQWEEMVKSIPSLPPAAQHQTKLNLEKIAKGHQQNYADMRARHAKDFGKMREMQEKNELRQEQIDLLLKQQAQQPQPQP